MEHHCKVIYLAELNTLKIVQGHTIIPLVSLNLTELINNHLSSRLPPVPEEGTDDAMFGRNDVYDFPSIMGK